MISVISRPGSDVAEGQFTDDETMQKFTEEMQYAQPRGPRPVAGNLRRSFWR